MNVEDIRQESLDKIINDDLRKVREIRQLENLSKREQEIDAKIEALSGPNPDMSVIEEKDLLPTRSFISQEVAKKRVEVDRKKEILDKMVEEAEFNAKDDRDWETNLFPL